MAKIKNWIYVTGIPRSGTTFIGHILSMPISADYIHEPFNPVCGIVGVNQQFLYGGKGSSNEMEIRYLVNNLKKYAFSLKTAFYPEDGPLRRMVKYFIGSRGPFYFRLAKLNPFHDTGIVKDPIGCFLTKFLVEEFGFKAVVVIRHPVGVVSSFLNLGWKAEKMLRSIYSQPKLVEDYFSDETDFFSRNMKNPIDAVSALWRAIYKVLFIYARGNKNIMLITHEEICKTPLKSFRGLYSRFNLPWSQRVEKKILYLTLAHGKAEKGSNRVQDFRRESDGIFDLRLKQVNKVGRRRIYEITKDVAEKIYPKNTFMIN